MNSVDNLSQIARKINEIIDNINVIYQNEAGKKDVFTVQNGIFNIISNLMDIMEGLLRKKVYIGEGNCELGEGFVLNLDLSAKIKSIEYYRCVNGEGKYEELVRF